MSFMASVAIDSTEIRPSPAADPEPVRRSRTLLVLGTAGTVAVLAGGVWVAHRYVPAFPQLGGLSSIVEPPRPARTDIRIGAFPPMPDIVNGVPALVEPRPVRVVGTAPTPAVPSAAPTPVQSGATPVSGATTSRPAAVAASRGASLLSPTLSAPAAMAAVEPARRIDDPGSTLGLLRQSEPARAAASPAPQPAARPEAPPAVAAAKAPAIATPVEPAALRGEPAETAALSPAPTRSPASSQATDTVPLPPPAPPRLARLPDVERSAPPVRTAARPRPAPVEAPAANAGPAPAAAAPKAEDAPSDERVEVLGLKLPNGRDIGNALSALGDSVKNLPKSF
jgi:hypothetical protein